MKKPLVLQKIEEVIRTGTLNEKELEDYYNYVRNWAQDKSEMRVLEYLINESKIIRFRINPNTAQLVQLDFNDTQRAALLKCAILQLQQISYGINHLIYTLKNYLGEDTKENQILNFMDYIDSDGLHTMNGKLFDECFSRLEESLRLLKGI